MNYKHVTKVLLATAVIGNFLITESTATQSSPAAVHSEYFEERSIHYRLPNEVGMLTIRDNQHVKAYPIIRINIYPTHDSRNEALLYGDIEEYAYIFNQEEMEDACVFIELSNARKMTIYDLQRTEIEFEERKDDYTENASSDDDSVHFRMS